MGKSGFNFNKTRLMDAVRTTASDALNGMAIAGADYADAGMQRIPPTIGKDGGKTWPGAPAGTFPAVRTSNLRRSMTFGKSSPDDLRASFGVYSGRESGGVVHKIASVRGTRGYASALEFGTRNMQARPWATLTLAGAPLLSTFQRIARRRFGELAR